MLVEIVWCIKHQLLLHVCLFGIHSDMFKFDILLKLNEGGLKRVLQLPTPQWQTDISRNYQIVGERAERVQRWGYECPVLVLSGAPASRESGYHQTPNMPPRTHWLAMIIENRAAKTTELLAYMISVRNARNAVSVKFLAECKQVPEKQENYCFWANLS